jgi:hypothetical protein
MELISFLAVHLVEAIYVPVICEGCGQRVPIPEGYRRNKIQCACGVICVVPEDARPRAEEPAGKRATPAVKPARDVEAEAERWLLDEPSSPPSPGPSEPPRFRDPEPVAQPAPAPKRTVADARFPCRRCGRMVRRQGECPDCDPDHVPAEAKEEPVWWPSVDAPEVKDDDEEEGSSSYGVEGADDVKCPKCCFMLPPGSVLCVRCGFHLKKRKKITKTYQPIERVWETNGSLKGRRTLFVICSTGFFVSGLIGVFHGGIGVGGFVFFYAMIAAMAAFLLGTFDTIHLTRDTRGRVQLIKTWRVCFFARPPRTIDVRAYNGIIGGRHRDIGPWEYAVCFFLLVSGIIPGIIWWYFVIHKVTFHVSLSRAHGFPECIVYSGWNDLQMKEIAYTLRDACGLPYDEG